MTPEQQQRIKVIGQQLKDILPDFQGAVKFNLSKLNKIVKVEVPQEVPF